MSQPPQQSSGNPAASGSPKKPALTALEKPAPFGFERILGIAVLVVVLVGGWLTRDYWVPSSLRFSKVETAPDGLTWMKFGTTRSQVLQQIAKDGGKWSSIGKPGMAPSAWAGHLNLKYKGLDIKEFSVAYSDGARYNFGAIPPQGDGPIDAEKLATPGSSDAKVVAIRWKVPRSFAEENSEVAAQAAMTELGLPHSEEKDVFGSGMIYNWSWPTVKASYVTLSGVLTIEAIDESKKIDFNGGKGTLAPLSPPPDIETSGPPSGESESGLSPDDDSKKPADDATDKASGTTGSTQEKSP